MKRFFQRKTDLDNLNVVGGTSNHVEFDVTKLPTDPGLRIPILDYNANI
jgi:hypothetical protein